MRHLKRFCCCCCCCCCRYCCGSDEGDDDDDCGGDGGSCGDYNDDGGGLLLNRNNLFKLNQLIVEKKSFRQKFCSFLFFLSFFAHFHLLKFSSSSLFLSQIFSSFELHSLFHGRSFFFKEFNTKIVTAATTAATAPAVIDGSGYKDGIFIIVVSIKIIKHSKKKKKRMSK